MKRLLLLVSIVLFISMILAACGNSPDQAKTDGGASEDKGDKPYYHVTTDVFEQILLGSELSDVQSIMAGEGQNYSDYVYIFDAEPNEYGEPKATIAVYLAEDTKKVKEVYYDRVTFRDELETQTLDDFHVDFDAIMSDRTISGINNNIGIEYRKAIKSYTSDGRTTGTYAFGKGKFSDGELGGYAAIFYLINDEIREYVTNRYL